MPANPRPRTGEPPTSMRAAGNGNYPGPGGGSATGGMSDAPTVSDPNALAGGVQGANPGATVTEITVLWKFTTYVYCAGAIVEKVQWFYTETMKLPSGVRRLPRIRRDHGPAPPGPWMGPPPNPVTCGALEGPHQTSSERVHCLPAHLRRWGNAVGW